MINIFIFFVIIIYSLLDKLLNYTVHMKLIYLFYDLINQINVPQ